MKSCLNTRETLKFFFLKVLTKQSKRWGIYSPQTELAVRAELAALTGNGRPARSTANGQKYDRWATAVDRPGRPKQTESSALSPVDRPKAAKRAQICARRSTGPVDRLQPSRLGQVD